MLLEDARRLFGKRKLYPQKVDSDLSPFTAENQPNSAYSTQNKAKRANKIVFLLLVRDQEVEGSNPFAPTTYFPQNQFVASSLLPSGLLRSCWCA
jgi:hypothetical protein